jgi:hypothetical protein
MSDLQQDLYNKWTTEQKRRFWIQMSHETPQEYERLVQRIKPATMAAREWVEMWRPRALSGAATR